MAVYNTFQLVSVFMTIEVAPASAVSPSSVHLGVTSLPCISTVPGTMSSRHEVDMKLKSLQLKVEFIL